MAMRSTILLCYLFCVLSSLFSHVGGQANTKFVTALASNACGQAGQNCCDGSKCNAGLYCDANSGNTCQYNCGGIGQYCCSNSPSGGCNGNDLFCQAGIGSEKGWNFCIENCGRAGQRCCRNNWCAGGFACNSTVSCVRCLGKFCPNGPKACGNPGEPCCTKDTCVAGTFCDTTSVKGQRICRPYCGAAGQRCCPVKNPTYDGCNKRDGVYCDTSANTRGTGGTGMCTYNCGFENQQCCPRGWCSDGLNCMGATCVRKLNCGGANMGCCSGDKPCMTGYFCFKNMCRQNCGQTGQPCCSYDNNWCKSGNCRVDGRTAGLCV